MVIFNKNISEEILDVSRRIYSWYKSGIKTLSISTCPFNTNTIFVDIVSYFVSERKKVLYISDEGYQEKKLLDGLSNKYKHMTYCKLESGLGECDINFVKYKHINNIEGNYDLVILDDISNFSTIDNRKLRDIYNFIISKSERIIVYSLEEVTMLGDKIECTPIVTKKPFIEPRVINTRIDLNKDIPYILYDYIKWFKDNKRNLVIYVPNSEALENVYEYYSNKLKLNKVQIKKVYKDKNNKINVLKVKDKATFIITDFKEISLEGTNIGDAIVLFADSDEYSYKQLMYICGQISKTLSKTSEILFVANEVTNTIDKVRDVSRDFNKMLWEKGL